MNQCTNIHIVVTSLYTHSHAHMGVCWSALSGSDWPRVGTSWHMGFEAPLALSLTISPCLHGAVAVLSLVHGLSTDCSKGGVDFCNRHPGNQTEWIFRLVCSLNWKKLRQNWLNIISPKMSFFCQAFQKSSEFALPSRQHYHSSLQAHCINSHMLFVLSGKLQEKIILCSL